MPKFKVEEREEFQGKSAYPSEGDNHQELCEKAETCPWTPRNTEVCRLCLYSNNREFLKWVAHKEQEKMETDTPERVLEDVRSEILRRKQKMYWGPLFDRIEAVLNKK